jgi:hypothetical protein
VRAAKKLYRSTEWLVRPPLGCRSRGTLGGSRGLRPASNPAFSLARADRDMLQGSRTQPESPSTHGGVPPEAALPDVNVGAPAVNAEATDIEQHPPAILASSASDDALGSSVATFKAASGRVSMGQVGSVAAGRSSAGACSFSDHSCPSA